MKKLFVDYMDDASLEDFCWFGACAGHFEKVVKARMNMGFGIDNFTCLEFLGSCGKFVGYLIEKYEEREIFRRLAVLLEEYDSSIYYYDDLNEIFYYDKDGFD